MRPSTFRVGLAIAFLVVAGAGPAGADAIFCQVSGQPQHGSDVGSQHDEAD